MFPYVINGRIHNLEHVCVSILVMCQTDWLAKTKVKSILNIYTTKLLSCQWKTNCIIQYWTSMKYYEYQYQLWGQLSLQPELCRLTAVVAGPGRCLVLTDAGGNYCYYTMIDAMIYKLGYLLPHQHSQAHSRLCIQQQQLKKTPSPVRKYFGSLPKCNNRK